MASKAVHDAVNARLEAVWTATPVKALNQYADPDTPFLVVEYPYSASEQLTFGSPGNNVIREQGSIRMAFRVETGSGVEDALAWADQLAALFRNQRFDGVRTFVPTTPVFDDQNVQGAYYEVSFAVPYQLDFTG